VPFCQSVQLALRIDAPTPGAMLYLAHPFSPEPPQPPSNGTQQRQMSAAVARRVERERPPTAWTAW
jgi:hypothetical protein